jgi:hypothetical protein
MLFILFLTQPALTITSNIHLSYAVRQSLAKKPVLNGHLFYQPTNSNYQRYGWSHILSFVF